MLRKVIEVKNIKSIKPFTFSDIEDTLPLGNTFHSYDVQSLIDSEVNMQNNKNQNNRKKNRRRKLPRSVLLSRKSRLIGSDDLETIINSMRYANEAGIRGPALLAAGNIADTLTVARELGLNGQHAEASAKAASCEYTLSRNETVASFKITCRDGKRHSVNDVIKWYSGVHARIASDISSAQELEAQLAERRRKGRELNALRRELENAQPEPVQDEVAVA